jgi:hypothetical protein
VGLLALNDNETIAAATMGRSTIFVDAGRHNDLPDFIFGKGSSFKQYIQKVAPVRIPWDKCTVGAPDVDVLPNVAPCQFVQMVNKKQRLHINQEVLFFFLKLVAAMRELVTSNENHL